MELPKMLDPFAVTENTFILPSTAPLPGLGILPVNCYVIRGSEPVLVDTGLPGLSDAFLEKLESVIDPGDLRWIWLTHADVDHTGSLRRLLELAPRAKLVTSYLGMGKLNIVEPVAPDRVYLLNPGQTLDIGDRRLTAYRPPVFDAPETTAFTDSRTGVLFSSDCFGALLNEARPWALEVPAEELEHGCIRWATVDAPWLHWVEARVHDQVLDQIRRLDPKLVLSTHLPPAAPGLTARLLKHLAHARQATPFAGPDQQALLAMLAA